MTFIQLHSLMSATSFHVFCRRLSIEIGDVYCGVMLKIFGLLDNSVVMIFYSGALRTLLNASVE